MATRTDKKLPRYVPALLVTAGVAAFAGIAWLWTKRSSANSVAAASPTAANAASGTALPAITPVPNAAFPMPGVPAPDPSAILANPAFSGSEAVGASVGDPAESQLQLGATYSDEQAPYYIVLYTSRMLSNGSWGPYDAPKAFWGHQIGGGAPWGPPIYSAPDDDVVAYLDALVSTNPSPGFWVAYAVPVTQETEHGVPTAVGAAGPWMMGRFGALQQLNNSPDLAAVLSFFNLPSSANVSEYLVVSAGPVPMTVEKALV